VLGLPDPAGGGAARGRAVHKAIEHYMRAKIAGLELEGEAITHEWDEIWDEACEGAEFAAHENIEALKASGAQLAGKYLREAAPAIQPLAVEVPVSGEIAGVKVRGIVDILDAKAASSTSRRHRASRPRSPAITPFSLPLMPRYWPIP
jgi:RecB family exonuclease